MDRTVSADVKTRQIVTAAKAYQRTDNVCHVHNCCFNLSAAATGGVIALFWALVIRCKRYMCNEYGVVRLNV